MNVDVVVNGRPWKVALEPAEQGGTFTVTIKGKSRLVDASWIDADTVSLIDGGASHEIRLHTRGNNGAVGVEFGGVLYEAIVAPGDAKRGREGFSAPSLGKTPPDPVSIKAMGAAVKAPMPGRVVRVLVAVGDRVTARQGVVVVEAMKMENELRSPRDGTVKEVGVVAGAAVETGAILVVIGD
jgi:biotin carboxyl carrier protein